MKKFISILLLFILAVNIVGFVFIFEIQRYSIKNEVAKILSEKKTTKRIITISITSFNKNKLVWKCSNEFIYNGLMYDIKSKETLNDGTVNYYCYLDKDENNLNKQINIFVDNNLDSRNKTNDLTKILIKLIIVNYIPAKKIEFLCNCNYNKIKSYNLKFYSSPIILLQSPPPKYI